MNAQISMVEEIMVAVKKDLVSPHELQRYIIAEYRQYQGTGWCDEAL